MPSLSSVLPLRTLLLLLNILHQQNLARQRAQEFGQTDIVHSLESSVASADTSLSSTSTLVVTSTATESETKGTDTSPLDELRTKPRGFFADQFEVSLIYKSFCIFSLKILQIEQE